MAPRGLSIDAHSLFPGGPMNPSGHGPGASLVLSKGGIGGELREALGHLSGPTFGDARGNYGLGERDNGPGGGGGPSIGLGHIDTRGIGHGLPATGPRLGPSGPKEVPKLPDPEVSPPTLEGVDKEMVRKVIHAHRNEVRFCYEQELTRAPDLTGKVTVKFIIAADGTVQSATVEQTTLANATVEHCVTSHVRAWLFPKLKAGGVVIVSYPFFFRSAGD
jgi:hypothetical protein